ncbi:MAG: hypothetical protein V4674_00270 [Patescibacteria group bacterium]
MTHSSADKHPKTPKVGARAANKSASVDLMQLGGLTELPKPGQVIPIYPEKKKVSDTEAADTALSGR